MARATRPTACSATGPARSPGRLTARRMSCLVHPGIEDTDMQQCAGLAPAARRTERVTRGGWPVRPPLALTSGWWGGAAEENSRGGHGREIGDAGGWARVKRGFI